MRLHRCFLLSAGGGPATWVSKSPQTFQCALASMNHWSKLWSCHTINQDWSEGSSPLRKRNHDTQMHTRNDSMFNILSYLFEEMQTQDRRELTWVLSSWKPSRKLSSNSSALSILSAYSPTIQIIAARASGSSRESKFSQRVAMILSYLLQQIDYCYQGQN